MMTMVNTSITNSKSSITKRFTKGLFITTELTVSSVAGIIPITVTFSSHKNAKISKTLSEELIQEI